MPRKHYSPVSYRDQETKTWYTLLRFGSWSSKVDTFNIPQNIASRLHTWQFTNASNNRSETRGLKINLVLPESLGALNWKNWNFDPFARPEIDYYRSFYYLSGATAWEPSVICPLGEYTVDRIHGFCSQIPDRNLNPYFISSKFCNTALIICSRIAAFHNPRRGSDAYMRWVFVLRSGVVRLVLNFCPRLRFIITSYQLPRILCPHFFVYKSYKIFYEIQYHCHLIFF